MITQPRKASQIEIGQILKFRDIYVKCLGISNKEFSVAKYPNGSQTFGLYRFDANNQERTFHVVVPHQ